MKKVVWFAAILTGMLLTGCSNDKAPAQQAVADIDSAISTVHDSAARFAPEALQGVEAQVADLRAKLAKGNYKEVLAASPTVKTSIASLKQDADAKQATADAAMARTKQQWRILSAEVPKIVANVHAQVDSLAKVSRLPKGVTKASFASAQTDAASLDPMWTEAVNTVANRGDYAGAVEKGQAVKEKAMGLMHALRMQSN
jgi:outer membrane murein-binding lipoprotein Lpp